MDTIWTSEKTTAELACHMLNEWKGYLEDCEDEVLQQCAEDLRPIINLLNKRCSQTRSFQAAPKDVERFRQY